MVSNKSHSQHARSACIVVSTPHLLCWAPAAGMECDKHAVYLALGGDGFRACGFWAPVLPPRSHSPHFITFPTSPSSPCPHVTMSPLSPRHISSFFPFELLLLLCVFYYFNWPFCLLAFVGFLVNFLQHVPHVRFLVFTAKVASALEAPQMVAAVLHKNKKKGEETRRWRWLFTL